MIIAVSFSVTSKISQDLIISMQILSMYVKIVFLDSSLFPCSRELHLFLLCFQLFFFYEDSPSDFYVASSCFLFVLLSSSQIFQYPFRS